MDSRPPGLSVRLKLALSYAGFLMIAGALLLAVVWVFLLRYVPDGPITTRGPFVPNRSDLQKAFTPAAAWALGFLLVFALVGGWLLAGRMLAPLNRITAATRAAANGSLSHRIAMEGPRDEFRELADAFDTMLARLEAQVAEQQRFAANASHELRTPLSISRTLLEVARADPAQDHATLIDQLDTVNARAIDLTEALLLLSRADSRAFVQEPVDLSLSVEEAVETLLPLAEQRGIAIGTSVVEAPTSGSRALLNQMVTNLVHNATVHNHPSGGTVEVRVELGQGSVRLTVENTGEVVPAARIAVLTEPFQRGSNRVRSDHGGVGLGLAIVRSIAEAHDGCLDVSGRPEGGLIITVELPLR